ncbi:hypothetical protein [Bacteroides xylanisolvens]|jgi:hypothetical protein|uniref:hypothetical protein n=1 Tax=Bacteroides xylanisolvens TaxID=371601 RepID=UPI00204CD11C|nr:MAG TPA: hypothetical protein [Caudoviricetes sp.]
MNGKFDVFFALLAKMPGATKEEIVGQYSGGTSLNELYERAPRLYRKMIDDMKKITASEEDALKMDKLRKRVIASIAGYFEKAGFYTGITRRERLKKIISTACRAADVEDLNDMTEGQMKRVYSEFIRKQKTAERAEKACEDAMKETGKVIQKGCLSLTLPK